MFAAQITTLSDYGAKAQILEDKLTGCYNYIKKYKDSKGSRFFDATPFQGVSFNLCEAILFGVKTSAAIQGLRYGKNKPLPPSRLTALLTAIDGLEAAGTEMIRLVDALAKDPQQLLLTDGAVLDPPKIPNVEPSQAVDAQPEPQVEGAPVPPPPPITHAYDFEPSAKALVQKADQALCALSNVAAMAGVRSDDAVEVSVVSNDIKLADQAVQSAAVASAAANDAVVRARSIAEEAATMKAQLNSAIADAKLRVDAQLVVLTSALEKIDSSAVSSASNSAIISAKLDEVARISAQAETAHSAITAYSATLDVTVKRVAETEGRANQITSEFDKQKLSVEELIVQANKMVSQSTVAGLAQAFSDEKKSLDQNIRWAQFGFYAGIFLLILATGFLVTYISKSIPQPPTIAGKGWVGIQSYEVTISGILSRSVILLGPTWLTLFLPGDTGAYSISGSNIAINTIWLTLLMALKPKLQNTLKQ